MNFRVTYRYCDRHYKPENTISLNVDSTAQYFFCTSMKVNCHIGNKSFLPNAISNPRSKVTKHLSDGILLPYKCSRHLKINYSM